MRYHSTLALVAALFLGGCASTQLTYNTLDVGGSIETIYLRQTLGNLSKTINDNWALPSHFEIAAGSVQTSNSISPSLGFPISNSIARSGAGVITGIATAGAGMTLGAGDGWQQSWTLAPITEAAQLRELRALYRKVLLGRDDPRYAKSIHNTIRQSGAGGYIGQACLARRYPIFFRQMGRQSSIWDYMETIA